jgi:hypothetical protein
MTAHHNPTAGARTSALRLARRAGLFYLSLVPLGFFGNKYIPSLMEPSNAAATINNILAHASLFRLSVLSALTTPIVTVLVALLLYQLLQSVNRNQAVLMVVFALAAAPIAMLNELNHFAVLLLLGGAGYTAAFSPAQIQSQVMFFLDLNRQGGFIAAIFWGLWLLPMGSLVFHSGFLPRIIGVLLIIAGIGYLIDCAALFLFPDLNVAVSQLTFIGELALLLWLLIKGVDVRRWERRAAEPA